MRAPMPVTHEHLHGRCPSSLRTARTRACRSDARHARRLDGCWRFDVNGPRPGWLRALYGLALCAVLTSCTPVASPVQREAHEQSSDAGASRRDAGPQTGADAGSDALEAARPNETCSEAGARSCAPGNPSRQPLQCVAGVWREQAACEESQRCEPQAGPDQGRCVKLARECIGRTPGERFCEGSAIRSCTGGVSRELERCDDGRQCVAQSDQVACRCQTGTVEIDGRCQAAVRCDQENGGCDALSTCSMENGARVCSACPEHFAGDGLSGCRPVLVELSALDATLMPEFASAAHAYRLRLPIFHGQLVLQPKAAEGVQIEINGVELAPGAPWRSDVLSFGENAFAVTLNARNGRSTRYEVIAERAGAEEAFIKAMYPETNDTFGYSVALSGDTLAVGATSEDSAIAGVNGDQTNNAAAESGAVYVFVREGASWRQQAYLKSSKPEEGNYFGGAVALDGDTLLVGEPRTTPYPNGDENAEPRPGIVHVFTRQAGEWTHQTSIASPSSGADMFGYSLALTQDTIAIGAPNDAAGGRNAGAVYTLARDGAWGPLHKLTARESTADDVFGWALALQGDRMLVGAPAKSLVAEHVGKVVAFARSGGSWQEQQVLRAEVAETGGCFGWSVALQGDLAAVGAPFASLFRVTPRGQAFVYQWSGASWALSKSLHATVPRDSDYFGSSVGFSGNALVVAASGDSSGGRGLNADPNEGQLTQSGAVYLFGRQSDDWIRTAFVKAGNAAANMSLGQATAVSGDTIVVGAINESSAASGVNGEPRGTTSGSGAVYVFR